MYNDGMDMKERPNHRLYIKTLRRMTPEQRLMKAFELSDFSRELFIQGLRKKFKGLAEKEFREELLKRLDKCHNRNY
ncbi:MAG: hypothetical protein HY751_06525 [Nitrospinae bacterium]|nr:hypothetical protein [Nitrospinota bacterium]